MITIVISRTPNHTHARTHYTGPRIRHILTGAVYAMNQWRAHSNNAVTTLCPPNISAVNFKAPVSIGDLLNIECHVLYTEVKTGCRQIHMEAIAHITDPQEMKDTISNEFHFTFEVKGETPPLRRMLPATPTMVSVSEVNPFLPRICSRTLMDCFIPPPSEGVRRGCGGTEPTPIRRASTSRCGSLLLSFVCFPCWSR